MNRDFLFAPTIINRQSLPALSPSLSRLTGFISFTKDAESSKLEFVKVNRVGYGNCIGIAQSFMWSALGEKMGAPILYPKASHIDLDAVSSVPPLCCGGF